MTYSTFDVILYKRFLSGYKRLNLVNINAAQIVVQKSVSNIIIINVCWVNNVRIFVT